MKNLISLPFKFVTYLSTIFLISFYGCTENPSITGYDLLNPQDSLIIKKFDSTRDSVFVYHKQIKQTDILGGNRRILVGKYNEIIAYSLIRVNFPLTNSLIDLLKKDSLIITSAKLILKPVYQFGDTISKSFGMVVKELNSEFGEYTFTIDSLKSGKYDVSNENLALQNIDDDSLYSCVINSDKVINWLKIAATDTGKKYRSLLLEPEFNTTLIKGFESTNAYYLGNPIYLQIVTTNNSNVDTLKFYVDVDVHVVDYTGNISTDDSKIILQSGVRQKAFLYFDISQIPKSVIVNSALIRIYLDSTLSEFGSNFQDSLIVQFITDSVNISIDSAVYFSLLKTSGGYYEGRINYFVQKWIDNNSNNGLLISPRDIDGGVEKFVLHGPKSALYEKRPQLIINYSYRRP